MKAYLPPVDYNLSLKPAAVDLCKVLGLTSDYETECLTALLCVDRPLFASEFPTLTSVSRTKVYGSLKRLGKAGLVTSMKIDEEALEKPELWGWLPERRKNQYLREHFAGVNFYTVNVPYIRSLYYLWTTEFYQRKLRIGKLMDVLEPREIPEPMEVEV